MRNLNTVHLNGLRALESVGRLGSLQAAADELGVTIGAVSQQINKAEAQLGRPVFERRAKGLVVTEFGTSVLARLAEGFQKLSEAVHIARRRESDALVISVAPVFASRWLVFKLERFSEQFPEIRLRIDATTSLIDPATSDVDLCIRVGRGTWPGMRAELILEQEVFPVCSPALAGSVKTPEDILKLPIVIERKAMFPWDVWLDAAGLSGREVTARHTFSEGSLCLDAAIAGQGVMLAWQTLTAYGLMGGQLVAPTGISAKTGFGHYFVTADGARETANIRAFKTWMREELATTMAEIEPLYTGRSRQLPAL